MVDPRRGDAADPGRVRRDRAVGPGPRRRGGRPNGGPGALPRASLGLRLLTLISVVVAAASGLVAGRIAVAGLTTPDRGVVAQQLAFLDGALRDGAAERMQRDYPEGFLLTHALVGLARAEGALPGDRDAAADLERALKAIDSPAGRAPFPPKASPPYGAFWSGWSLLVATEHARITQWVEDLDDVRKRAVAVRNALRDSGSGFLESYPGQRWPCDTVLALAALARADRLVDVPDAEPVIRGWTQRTRAVRDPETGLLPHLLVGGDPEKPPRGGDEVAEGPRATSQSMILAFEPDYDPDQAAADYTAFVSTFVTRRAGLVGVLEYPRDRPGTGDVDSGPLVLGVSASSSVVTLAAARRNGDRRLARTLEGEAEFLGMPVTWRGGRRYAAGLIPVGDAFLAWARSRPFGESRSLPRSPSVTPAPATPSPGAATPTSSARTTPQASGSSS